MCGTIWQRTSIHCSYLRQTSFVDSTFVDVTFSGCDLRGADFSAAEIERLPVADIHFVDCDLRDTRWLGRDMSSVVFGNCRTHGMIEGAWASYLSKAHVSGRECRPSAALRSVRCLATPVHISVRDA
jgi:uncharacterized protein YjbI with pentapeptide repeats